MYFGSELRIRKCFVKMWFWVKALLLENSESFSHTWCGNSVDFNHTYGKFSKAAMLPLFRWIAYNSIDYCLSLLGCPFDEVLSPFQLCIHLIRSLFFAKKLRCSNSYRNVWGPRIWDCVLMDLFWRKLRLVGFCVG